MAPKNPDKFIGKQFTDRISGFEGEGVAVVYFASGNIQVQIAGGTKERIHEAWVDEDRLIPATTPKAKRSPSRERVGAR